MNMQMHRSKFIQILLIFYHCVLSLCIKVWGLSLKIEKERVKLEIRQSCYRQEVSTESKQETIAKNKKIN